MGLYTAKDISDGLMPCKKISREEGFLGGIILQKMRLGNLLGEVSKNFKLIDL